MNIARKTALEVVEKYGNGLQGILDAEGVQIIYFALAGRLKELYFGDFIILKSGLPEAERHELIAHALGHHFLHAGNHFFVSTSDTNPWDKLQERQAEVFAAYLLMPKVNNLSVQEIANSFTVTEKFASFRLKLLKAYKQ
ncbi:MAG: hypothetical protein COW32_01080 [Candidatus Aquicultor secundus]|uniref:IrrE N-terminal-like domain-containing protein n=1 Tax=Candidatus Aquicultor secundus TaxID=1973895 RepID=A0A2M7TAB8_9ACTN|nr:ImmA/IrrE family metallo-endopeptidase [Candidatus Aquicultor secundus]PIU27931.1 MAG: hypothetical protein COT10_00900 [Candidatus Aquicultor secundus]PIW23106.1 MAG: hypothetical protein COW32_01080 [Candidatus Aquicultor secundus]PIZ41222.1 MAG: hypothetical protein COY37_02665 [Candidatus Aquicultor secundus]